MRLIHRLGALVGVVGAALVATGLPAGAATAPVPRISVTPSTALVDGQIVHVAVKNFPPNVPIAVVQCAPNAVDVNGCDTRSLTYLATGPKGMATTPFIVAAKLIVNKPAPNTVVDCRKVRCTVGVGTIDQRTVAGVKVSFDPHSVLAPPLKTGLTVTSTGVVNTTSHVATITGTITCNRPALVYLNGQVSQLIPFMGVSAVSRSYISHPRITCGNPDKTVQWSAKVGTLASSQEGSFLVGFKPGKVHVDAYASGRAGGSSSDAEVDDQIVTLSAPT